MAFAQTFTGVGALVRRLVVAVSILALGLGLTTATTFNAHAATPGLNIDVLHEGAVVDDGTMIPEGDDIILRVQYDAAEDIAGQQIDITLPTSISFVGDLPSNDAVDTITQNPDGTLTITFKDPIPAGITEGAFVLNLQANEVDHSVESPITWQIGEEENSVTITVENIEPPVVEVEDGYNKSVSPNNLDGFVQNSGSPDYEFTGLNPNIANQTITYTLVLASAEARSNYEIADELDSSLSFVPGSFDAELTTSAGTDPFTFVPTITGNAFTGTVDVPAQSTLRITYDVQVTDIPALESLLAVQYENRANSPGNYQINVSNDAVFGELHERSVNVRLRGNIPGVNIGNNFAKNGNWTLEDVIADEDGNLQPAAEMTYSFRANLTPWDERNANFTLQQNVVISDTLIDQASWQTGSDFLSISGVGPITALTEATGFTGTAADFVADQYVGQFAIVDQTLLINVGRNNTTNVTIEAKAELTTVDELTGTGNTTVIDGTHYAWNNTAAFHYRSGTPVNRDHNAGVVVLPANYDEGVNDSAAFNKFAVDSEVRVNPGEQAEVPYRFEIDTSKPNIDRLNSRIIDEIDTDIFDVSDLDAIDVSGNYGGTALDRSHFDLSMNVDGHLVIELSDAGKTLVGSLPEDQQLTINLTLVTVPFDGKQTFEVYNRATLESDGSEWNYWSEFESEATSYGNEAEIRKRLFNPVTGEWASELDGLITDGEFDNPTFIYSIELIPRGNYGQSFPVSIFTREDILPDALDFLGFVEVGVDGNPDIDSTTLGPINMGGNVVATYADGVVTISQASGTSLNPNETIVVYYAAEANDASGVIVNSIAGSDTTITPVGDPSIDIEKWNDEGAAPEYDDAGALLNDGFEGDFDAIPGKPLAAGTPLPINFTISNDGREDLVNVVVSDELTAGAGEIQDLVCVFPDDSTGTEWEGPFEIGTQFECTGTLPALKSGDEHQDLAQVSAVGILTDIPVTDEDEWNGYVPTPSVDIEKWNDEGAAPEYDDAGALLNDGFEGDFDMAPGKKLESDESLPINFTISNDGEEPLINIVVSDELVDGSGEIENLECVFPDDSTGTEWEGPLDIGAQFECVGTLPGLEPDQEHVDLANVTAVGLYSGNGAEDEDEWHGFTEPLPVAADDSSLTATGMGTALWSGLAALLMLMTGGAALLARNRRKVRIDI